MPSRNVVKIDIENTYYHVYARGHDKMDIYRDDEDFRVYLNLLKRYLGIAAQKDNSGRLYLSLRGDLELICYCLMPNHFHLLIYQFNSGSMTKLLHCVATSYSRYFNKKYKLSGALFETTYKASIINDESYLLHISRYIHLNPDNWGSYCYSSLHNYVINKSPTWLIPDRVLDMFSSGSDYLEFLSDYNDQKKQFNPQIYKNTLLNYF